MPEDINRIKNETVIQNGNNILTGTQSINGRLNFTGTLSNNNPILDFGQSYIVYSDNTGTAPATTRLWFSAPDSGDIIFGSRNSNNRLNEFRVRANRLVIDAPGYSGSSGYLVWHQGNQGAGTGMDADTVDGLHAGSFALVSHTHNASDINAGSLHVDRIPSLPASKVTTGTFDVNRIPSLPPSKISGVLDVTNIPDLPASKVTSGSFDASRIPSLDASKITTGVLNAARIPSLDAGVITTGAFADARIPALNASKITAGTFADARIPNLNASKITAGTFHVDRIPNLSGAKITSGTVADARLSTAVVRTNKSNTFSSAYTQTVQGTLTVTGTLIIPVK